MFGMSPASPCTARVLDVGCAAGANLLPMAMLWPHGEYVGIFLSSSAIEKATAKARQ
jgi:tRNA G46 methylase TrmB